MKDWKTLVWAGLAVVVLVGCSQPTQPAKEDTSCRSGVSISSGRKCP